MINRHIKRQKRKIISLFLVFALFFTVTPVQATEQPVGEITFSIEKFTIGQGYFLEPQIVPIYLGDTYKSVLDRTIGEEGYITKSTSASGFYLAAIKNADLTGKAESPRYISEADPLAPSTEVNVGNEAVPDLGEFAYGKDAGWVYSVNGSFPTVGMGACSPEDGDVMRLQFSVYGLGGDVGNNNMGASCLPVAKRESLTKAMASFNKNRDKKELLKKPWIREAYDNAMNVLVDLEEPQASVDKALSWLNHAAASEKLAGIRLSETEKTMQYGETGKLTVVFEPSECAVPEGVRWKSSDNTVAWVEQDGTIYADMDGTAVITAEIGDYKTSCEVTVKVQEGQMLGDVDNDGRITSSDALLALQASVGKINLDVGAMTAADVDRDGEITSSDALQILQYSVGKINRF